MTIDYHTQNLVNHKKIIVSNGSAVKKTFNGDGWEVTHNHRKTIDGNGTLKKKYYHPIVGKYDHRTKSTVAVNLRLEK